MSFLQHAPVDVWEEDEALETTHFDQAMICALIKLPAIELVGNVNLMIAFATLLCHCVAIHIWFV